jgi:hypothetical protein
VYIGSNAVQLASERVQIFGRINVAVDSTIAVRGERVATRVRGIIASRTSPGRDRYALAPSVRGVTFEPESVFSLSSDCA